MGVKCAACTGDPVEPVPARPPRRSSIDDGDDSRRAPATWRRAAFPVAVAVAVIAAVAVAVVGVRWATNSPSGPAAVPSRPDSTDVRVSFTGAGGLELAGTLTLPAKSFQPAPAVLIIPDSGTVDRDGITRPGNVADRLYADLAQSFSARGWATLRYDPRGQGQSTAPPGMALQLSDLVGDAGAGLGFLAARPEVNAQRLTILGDGWGGLVAMQVAGEDSRASRVVLVSTPGRPVVDTVADHVEATAASPAEGQRQAQQLRSAVAALESGGHLPATGDLDPALRPILQPSQEDYLRAIFSTDPVSLARQVRVATLIVRGSQDPAITAADSDALASAIGNPATTLIASGAGHTLAIETPTRTTATTSAPAANSGIQSVLGTPQQAVTRDTFTVGAIGNWMAPQAPPPAPPPGGYTPPPGGGTGR